MSTSSAAYSQCGQACLDSCFNQFLEMIAPLEGLLELSEQYRGDTHYEKGPALGRAP